MSFRAFSEYFQGVSGCFRGVSGCFQGVFTCALSGYALWTLPREDSFRDVFVRFWARRFRDSCKWALGSLIACCARWRSRRKAARSDLRSWTSASSACAEGETSADMGERQSTLKSQCSSALSWIGIAGDPKGPKIEKIQDRPPGLKFSIEIENFKRATQQNPSFCGEF